MKKTQTIKQSKINQEIKQSDNISTLTHSSIQPLMNTDTLKKIFQSPFNYPIYSREIVHSLFGCNDVLTQPELIDTSSLGDSSHYVGQMEDAEGRLLGFFYTRVAEGSDVRRKRVGLRKLIQPYLRYEVDAAIAVFDDGQHWRLSYICDHKEGTTSAKRFSYVLGDRQGQYKTPLERLDKVSAKAGRFKMEDLKDAFSVDALSKEFFDEYHRHYDRILRTTDELISKDPTLYSGLSKLFADYIKKMMGRIVFLHFLQKKGWLNGDPEFLKNLFFMQPPDRREDFLEQVLEPLFFGIFNTEPQNREKLFRDEGWDVQLLEQWKGLPYLNGGLFERDMMDTAKLKLPASLFERLFDFMASYNFTVDENDPDDADIGVDPEMLGKIFESLLEDNKAKGAFYTPKEIVRYMCKESLIAYLGTQTTGLSKEPGVQATSLSKESGVQAYSLSKESGVKATGLSKEPGVKATGLSKESGVKATSLSKEPGVQATSLSKEPGVQATSLSKEPGVQATSLSKEPEVKATGLSKEPGVKATSLSKEPGVKATGLSDYIRKFVEQHEFPEELEPYREVLYTALRKVKICDPAIGSGAFPMGLLNELWRCREALEERAACPSQMGTQAKGLSQAGSLYSEEGQAGSLNPYSRAALKREIIENNIYGVDIERGAIDIARLRFWLSIVVDAEKPEPLPNFDYKFMQGNSLIESFDGHDLSHILDKDRGSRPLPGRGARRAGWAENQTGMEFGSDEVKQNLRNWLKMYFSLTDHQEKAYYRELINSSVKNYIVQQGIGPAAETRLNTIDPSATQDFFLWHTWFKDIFDNGGFDIVIGNPPYGANIDSLVREYNRLYPGVMSNIAEIYKLFFALFIRICREYGYCTLITPNTYLSQPRYKDIRKHLLKYRFIKIIDLGENVFNATVSTAITIIAKDTKIYDFIYYDNKNNIALTAFEDFPRHIIKVTSVNCSSDISICIATESHFNTKPLDEIFILKDAGIQYHRSNIGLKNKGGNDLYERIFSSNPIFFNECVPTWYGKRINRYYISQETDEFFNLNYKTVLKQNESVSFNLEAFNQPVKIIWRQTASSITASIDTEQRWFRNTIQCGYLKPEYKDVVDNYYALAVLNSKYIKFIYNNLVRESGRVFPQIKLTHLRKLPFVVASAEMQNKISELAKTIIGLKQSNPTIDTSTFEHEIDILVYQLYNLTPEEIEIIEENAQ